MNTSGACYYTTLSGFKLSPFPNCISGLYCPWLKTKPVSPEICLPTDDCFRRKLEGHSCFGLEISQEQDVSISNYGAQGLYEPVVCPPSFYCPSPTLITTCPESHFCPTGSIQPITCDFLAYCPSGSIVQKSYQYIVIAACFDLVLLLVYLLIKRRPFKNIEKYQLDLEELTEFQAPIIQISLEAKNVTSSLRSGKVILDNINLKVAASKMTAVIGPSGSGKSSLIKVLTGQNHKHSGTVLINDQEMDIRKLKKIIGCVPQRDSLLEELTVLETIVHSAKIRLPATWNRKQIHSQALDILDQLDLSHTANQLVCTLSGGEKRRVSIGIELVSNPSCLFLDEPTTGLDSASALQVINILERMAAQNMTILCVLHQPRFEIFKKFDNVIMLSNSGTIVYNNTVQSARYFFEEIQGFQFTEGSNESDIFLDIISGNGTLKSGQNYSIDEPWKDELPKGNISAHISKINKKLLQSAGASFIRQFICCHNLSLRQQYRKIDELLLEIGSCSFIGMMLGVVMTRKIETYTGIIKEPFMLLSSAPDFTNVVQIPFITCLVLTFSATPAGIKVFTDEIDSFKRWERAGHSKAAYFLAKNVSTLYRIYLASFHFAAFAYYFSTPVYSFSTYFLVISSLYFAIYGLCSFVSFAVKKENATLFAVTLVIFLGALSGYAPTLKKAIEWNAGFLFSISYNRYAVEALFSETLAIYQHIFDSTAANTLYLFDLGRTRFDVLMINLIGLGWRVLAFVIMCFRSTL